MVFSKVKDTRMYIYIYIIWDEELQQKNADEEEKRADRKFKILINKTNYL